MTDTLGDIDKLSDKVERTHMDTTTKKASQGKMSRKQSTPMMPAFMVSAPGKVIVFGEHAVVHGKVTSKSLLMMDGG